MDPSKETEKINEEGEVEKTVKTVDYRKPAGEDQEPVEQKARVVHQIHEGNTGPIAGATTAVKNTVQSAKDKIFGNDKNTTATEK